MKKYLLLLLFSAMCYSQADYHYVSMTDKDDVAAETDFAITKVYDGRQFKGNIGTVQKGAFNRKTLARFEKSFDTELADYFAVIYPKTEGKKEIALRVSDLYVSELTGAMSETGFATVVVDFIEEIDGVPYIVATYSSNAEGKGADVTHKHDERIKAAFSYVIDHYVHTSPEKKTRIVFNPEETVTRVLNAKPRKGIYVSYKDVLNDKPLDTANFRISSKGKQYYLYNLVSDKSQPDYYGFSDGANFFINVSKYASGKYYAKTELIGNKYFIEDVVYNPNNAIAMGAMFGVVGIFIASSSGNDTSPMMIDVFSGQPMFLSRNDIKALLEPKPELLKEFKSSKKTNEDIKNVLRKYYAWPTN